MADEDPTEVYMIEGSSLKGIHPYIHTSYTSHTSFHLIAIFIIVLFMRQPALAGRFFQYLSSMLSTRLKLRETTHYSHQQ